MPSSSTARRPGMVQSPFTPADTPRQLHFLDIMSAAIRSLTVLVGIALMTGCWGGPNHKLGIIEGTLAPCPSSPNCVHTGMRHPDGTKGMFADTRVPRAELMELISSVVQATPRTSIIAQDGDYLHAEMTSRIFRFVDDLEILISFDNEVIIRSASRVGRGDMGVNSARVEDLRVRLQAAGAIR